MANGTRRCRLHGGASLSGIAHPRFKHGRYSKIVPRGLGAKVMAAAADRELLSLRDEVALNDVRIDELLGRINEKETDDLWGLVMKGVDRRRKLVTSESKRLAELGQVLTCEQAVALIQRLSDIVRRNVSDQAALRAIAAEFREVVERM